MQASKSRVQNYRQKLRAAGLKPVQLWLPDPAAPGFAEECRRQSRLLDNDPVELAELHLLDQLFDDIAGGAEE